MEHHGLPHINTNASASGHAHPSYLGDAPKDEAERLRDIIDKVALDVVLHGLASDNLPPACAPVLPRVRRGAYTEDVVQHLDVVSCWKGLSASQALEVATWEHLFKEALASQLKQRLQQDFTNQLGGYPDPTNEALLVPRMIELLTLGEPLLLDVSIAHLVHDMISQLYSMHRSDTTHRKFSWSLSSGGLSDFVYNFIRTQDCILDTPDGPCVLFDLSHSYIDGILTAFANIEWHPPRVTFAALPTRLSRDEVYRITPGCFDTMDAAWDSGFRPIKDVVKYAVPGSTLPMQWDYTRGCFHAPVSLNFEACGGMVETIICARITTQFHDSVHFERISRYNIKLEVCEERHTDMTRCNSSPIYDKFDGGSLEADSENVSILDPHLQDSFRPSCESKAELPDEFTSSWVPSYTSTPRSKTGHTKEQDHESIGSESCARQVSQTHPCSRSNFDAVESYSTSTLTKESWTHTSSERTSTSPSKRKIWAGSAPKSTTNLCVAMAQLKDREDSDTETDIKRRKLERPDDTNVHIVIDPARMTCTDVSDNTFGYNTTKALTDILDKAQTSLPSDNPSWFQKLHDLPGKRGPTLYAAASVGPAPSTRQTTSSPDSLLPDNPPTSLWVAHQDLRTRLAAASSSPANEIIPPATTSASTSTSTSRLTQEQIQHNYQEFEERKKRKAAEKAYYAATVPGFDGIVSPTEEDNKTFEHMFLEESDASDWVEGDDDDDGISEGMGTVCLNEC